jgi:NAD(P)H-hydrate repair Nnr-like enzyme with NAD(P)H-hydrate dehydratase domain
MLFAQNADAVSKVVSTFPRLHVLVIGPGLGRNPRVMTIVSSIMREATKKAIP